MGVTKQRQVIRTIVSAGGGHMTAEQVYAEARITFPNISLGTVYRNLNLMADEGAIRRLSIPGQPVWFDKNTFSHQHMTCVRCGGIEDIGDIGHSEMRKLVGPTIDVIDHTLLIYVVCQKCMSEE